jgi:hypothetical protein
MFEQTFEKIDGKLQKNAGCGTIGFLCKAFEYIKDSNSKAFSSNVPGVPQVPRKT